ncbi:GMC family oxidoreductase [Arthrobacter ramosus]|uniref:GMC family oxidoreductase n=1 Tax=Arthrobacter ramosus TaxID=1672 RepID=A0ABV5XVU3_ARTRM|nr:GMC family oxidoreductase [Arthrobacter ramosus]
MSNSTVDAADVLVIGAGAAGAALTWSLAKRGLKVLCLEQGDWVNDEDIPKNHADWEVRGRHYWNPSPGKRRGPADYPVTNLGDNPVDVYMYSSVGGSAIGYGGHFWRFQPSDFVAKTQDGFGVDWPIRYENLVPYYELNEKMMGVSGVGGDPVSPGRHGVALPPVPIGQMGDRWIEGFDRLGWYYWAQSQAILSRDYKGRPACANRGFCAFGCPSGALALPSNTYWPEALSYGARLKQKSRVREIVVDATGRATGARYYDEDGQVHEARATTVVICGNGVGTPRLLLMSKSSKFPDGLANSSGQVGKNFMPHVQTMVIARFEEPTDADQGAWGATVASRHFYETDPANDHKRGFTMAAMRGYSPLNTALATAPWGIDHHSTLEHHLNHEATIWVCGDDAPEEHNRVELDTENVDAFGLPGVKTYYTLSENSKRLGAHGVRRATELAYAAGADSVRTTGFDSILGWHLLGTARMGSDPANSVVNADNRAHDVPNLYIVDGSSFATGGAVNPTHTIQALALRAAEKIWEARNS